MEEFCRCQWCHCVQGILLIRSLKIRGFGKFAVFETPNSPQIQIFSFKKQTKRKSFMAKITFFCLIFVQQLCINKDFKTNFMFDKPVTLTVIP